MRPWCAACGFVQFHDPKVAVVALVTSDVYVLLVRRTVEPGKGMWALPGGYVDEGEMPEIALKRELLEEVGLDVQVGVLLGIYPLTSAKGAQGIVLAYAATVDGPVPAGTIAGDEIADAQWFDANTLPIDIAFDSTLALVSAWARSVHLRD